jgi:hypothetical protein
MGVTHGGARRGISSAIRARNGVSLPTPGAQGSDRALGRSQIVVTTHTEVRALAVRRARALLFATDDLFSDLRHMGKPYQSEDVYDRLRPRDRHCGRDTRLGDIPQERFAKYADAVNGDGDWSIKRRRCTSIREGAVRPEGVVRSGRPAAGLVLWAAEPFYVRSRTDNNADWRAVCDCRFLTSS